MVAQVHAGERIVPAADNQAIIQALNGGTDLKQLILAKVGKQYLQTLPNMILLKWD